MLAIHTTEQRAYFDPLAADPGADPTPMIWAIVRKWIAQTLLAGILGAVAAAIAGFLLLRLFTGGGELANIVVLGVFVSGAAAGVIAARRDPAWAGAPRTRWVETIAALSAPAAALGIAGLRSLRLVEAPLQSWDDGLGAVYVGIAVSAVLLFAAAQWVVLSDSLLDPTAALPGGGSNWGSVLARPSEVLGLAGSAAMLLAFFLYCGRGMPPAPVLAACLGLALGALAGFTLARHAK